MKGKWPKIKETKKEITLSALKSKVKIAIKATNKEQESFKNFEEVTSSVFCFVYCEFTNRNKKKQLQKKKNKKTFLDIFEQGKALV